MAHSILILNGPNLNLLGTREPDTYGHETLDDVTASVVEAATARGLETTFVQSNHEGVLIDAIHEARTTASAIIINPGGLTHTSVSLRDAIASVELPTVEVHISNVHRREEFRHHSYISAVATATIVGAGTYGYVLAVDLLAHQLGR